MTQLFSGYYRLTPDERLQKLANWKGKDVQEVPYLPQAVGERMIENYVANFPLPLGLAVNFLINGKSYVIPMAVEEPSVVAAASNAGKILGNISTTHTEKTMTGQIIIACEQDVDSVVHYLNREKDHLLSIARDYSSSMIRRGGGPVDLAIKTHSHEKSRFITLYLTYNPCDAMGANSINTVLEAIARTIEQDTGISVLMSILSNYSENSLATAKVQVPIDQLHSDPQEALLVAERIVMANDYAKVDPYRAVTHNKGIMNGIDPIVIATGNDFRAVEASVQAYASRNGHYQALTEWTISRNEDSTYLMGELTLPLPVATVGGTISVHPTAQWALDVIGCQHADELAQIMVAVGLAQNFAALKALVTDGIQKGHMRLHAQSIAVQLGATGDEIDELVNALKDSPVINRQIAQSLLLQLRSTEENEND